MSTRVIGTTNIKAANANATSVKNASLRNESAFVPNAVKKKNSNGATQYREDISAFADNTASNAQKIAISIFTSAGPGLVNGVLRLFIFMKTLLTNRMGNYCP